MPVESPRRVAVATLGCKVNQCESAAMADRLKQLGHTVVGFDAEADVFIINTCTVTARTDFQSRQLIRRAARRNPGAPVIVTGCYAQVAPDLLKELPNVRLVAGNVEKELIPGLVGTLNGGPADVLVRDIGQARQFSGLTPDRFPGRTRAFLKIQDGCNARCSYCIVPKARGPSRSMPEDHVLERVASLAAAGYREIVLTGIHLGAWGQDLSPSPDFPSLVRRIGDTGQIGRLRLSSIEPLEVTDELIACLRDSTVLCRHLHIPLQSGDDRILSVMGRHYDRHIFQGTDRAARLGNPRPCDRRRRHGRIPRRGGSRIRKHGGPAPGASGGLPPRLPLLGASGHGGSGDAGKSGGKRQGRARGVRSGTSGSPSGKTS